MVNFCQSGTCHWREDGNARTVNRAGSICILCESPQTVEKHPDRKRRRLIQFLRELDAPFRKTWLDRTLPELFPGLGSEQSINFNRNNMLESLTFLYSHTRRPSDDLTAVPF